MAITSYSDMDQFADFFDKAVASEDTLPLLSYSDTIRPQPPKFPWRRILGGGLGLISLAAGITLKVYNMADTSCRNSPSDEMCSYKYDTIANLINGLAVTMLSDSLLPQKIHSAVFNEIKRYAVPLFEIASNIEINVLYANGVYGNPAATQAVRQLLITPLTMATSALTLDDLLVLRNLTPKDAPDERIRRKPIPLLIEGDAKSLKRLALQQGAILALGIALTTLGLTLHMSEQSKVLLRDAGIVTGTYALGSILAQESFALLEKLKNQNHNSPPTRVLTCLNTIIKAFQLGWPMGVGMTVVPDNPVSYGITGLLYGAGQKLTQTFFQYRQADSEGAQNGIINRIKGLFATKKKDIALNAIFYAIATGWMIWGEDAGGSARIRGAVGALFGSTVVSAIATAAVDLVWKRVDSGFII